MKLSAGIVLASVTTPAIFKLGHLLALNTLALDATSGDWLDGLTSIGFAGLVWYLLAVQQPRREQRDEERLLRHEKAMAERDALFDKKRADAEREHQQNIEAVIERMAQTRAEQAERHERQVEDLVKSMATTVANQTEALNNLKVVVEQQHC